MVPDPGAMGRNEANLPVPKGGTISSDSAHEGVTSMMAVAGYQRAGSSSEFDWLADWNTALWSGPAVSCTRPRLVPPTTTVAHDTNQRYPSDSEFTGVPKC